MFQLGSPGPSLDHPGPQAPALVLATAVVMFCIAYPLGLATSAHLCGALECLEMLGCHWG